MQHSDPHASELLADASTLVPGILLAASPSSICNLNIPRIYPVSLQILLQSGSDLPCGRNALPPGYRLRYSKQFIGVADALRYHSHFVNP